MLISAEKARSTVEDIIKAQETEEMKEIEELIINEINKGKFCASFYGELKDSTKECLKKSGYRVYISRHYDETCTTIKW